MIGRASLTGPCLVEVPTPPLKRSLPVKLRSGSPLTIAPAAARIIIGLGSLAAEGEKPVTEAPSSPLPNDLRQAFCQAVRELRDWKPPATQPTAPYRQGYSSIGAICEFVERYAPDPMPEELVGMILGLRKHDPNNPVLHNRTFPAGARYVLAVIEQRNRARQEVDRMAGGSRLKARLV